MTAGPTSASGPARAQGDVPGSKRVRLTFDWPHGTGFSVHTVHQRRRDQEVARSAVTYTVGVTEIGAGLRIDYSAYTPYFHVPGALPTRQHGMRARLSQAVPAIRTDGEGHFVEVEGLDRIKPKGRRRAIGARGQLARLVRPTVTDRALTHAAKRFWDYRVGMWLEHGELEQGKKYLGQHTMDVPELDGARVKSATVFELVGWQKCEAGAVEARCVEIHLETDPDPKAMQAAITKYRKGGGRDHDGAIIRAVEKKERVQVILDPLTLRSHSYKEDLFTMVGAREKTGRERQTMTFDSHVETYTHH